MRLRMQDPEYAARVQQAARAASWKKRGKKNAMTRPEVRDKIRGTGNAMAQPDVKARHQAALNAYWEPRRAERKARWAAFREGKLSVSEVLRPLRQLGDE